MLLDQFNNEDDPFLKARKANQSLAEMQKAQFVGFPGQEVQQQEVASSQPDSMITSLNSKPLSDFDTSGIPKMLQKLGVDDKNIAINSLGKIQLLSRLQKKFGPGGLSPDALNVMNKFDELLNKYPMDRMKKESQTVSNGERTLKALLGG